MKTGSILLLICLSVIVVISACKKKTVTPTTKNIELNLSGLEDLGADFVYEGWLIVNGSPVSTGTFTVNANGDLSKTSFEVNITDADNATTFVLSIEPKNDPDPAPANTKLLSGDFSGNNADVGIAPVGDFSAASGKYILATPTDTSSANENSGIWFLELPGPAVGLNLPQLPAGWKYEGWAVINGVPVTTGKFTKMAATDENDPFSGPIALPMPNGPDGFFPGEDFLNNAPAGLVFPTDLAGGKAVISIEPDPDNSPDPFTLKPLVDDIPANATDHVVYNISQNLNFPSGMVTR